VVNTCADSARGDSLGRATLFMIMTSAAEVKKRFLSQPQFAVVGASKDQTKWGTKILKWYIDRNKQVTPIHPV